MSKKAPKAKAEEEAPQPKITGCTRDGHKTTTTYDIGDSCTIEHASVDAAKEYAASHKGAK